MTHFSKTVVPSVAFMLMTTAAHALTPVGEVYTPEDASENAPFWQPFTVEKGDRHWTYAARFLDEANLRGKVKGVTSDGVYFPPEAVVMGAIEAANGAEKFDGDKVGYPTFKAGKTYVLPVPTAEGYTVPPQPVTQAELLAQLQQQEKLYEQLQSASQEAYANFSVRMQQNSDLLGTMRGELDGLSASQEQLQESQRALEAEQSVIKQSTADNQQAIVDNSKSLGTLTGEVQTAQAVAAEAKELAKAAGTEAGNALDVAKQTSSDLNQFKQDLPGQIETEVNKQLANTAGVSWWVWAAIAVSAGLALLALLQPWFFRKTWKNLREKVATYGKKIDSHEELLNGPGGVIAGQKALAADQQTLATEVRDENDGLAATHEMAATVLSKDSKLEFLHTTDLRSVNVGGTSTWTMRDGYREFAVDFTKRADGLFDSSIARNADGTGESEPMAFKSSAKLQTRLQHAYVQGRLQNCVVETVQAA